MGLCSGKDPRWDRPHATQIELSQTSMKGLLARAFILAANSTRGDGIKQQPTGATRWADCTAGSVKLRPDEAHIKEGGEGGCYFVVGADESIPGAATRLEELCMREKLREKLEIDRLGAGLHALLEPHIAEEVTPPECGRCTRLQRHL